MTRDELFTLCDHYVHDDYVHDDTETIGADDTNRCCPDPTTTIIHCFREAEISAAEMQSLLAYVCQNQNDDLDWSDADQFCDGSDGIGRLGNPGDSTSWATAESNIDSIANRRPR